MAVVFLADASFSPGVVNHEVYSLLVPKMQAELRQLCIPLVTEAHGVVLAEDGIHWRITSSDAIEGLIRKFVYTAIETRYFRNGQLPILWYWLYNPLYASHYPTCTMCQKRLSNAHLNSKSHKAKAIGSASVFEFPSRETYCDNGVRFRQLDNPEQQNISPTLRHDYPMPDSRPRVSMTGLLLAESVDVVEMEGKPAPNSRVARTCLVTMRWNVGVQAV
jgi:hypothetical protein